MYVKSTETFVCSTRPVANKDKLAGPKLLNSTLYWFNLWSPTEIASPTIATLSSKTEEIDYDSFFKTYAM